MQKVRGTLSICLVSVLLLSGCGKSQTQVLGARIEVENCIPDIIKIEDVKTDSASLILTNQEIGTDLYEAYFYEVEGHREVNINGAETNIDLPIYLYDFILETADKSGLSDAEWIEVLDNIQNGLFGRATINIFLNGGWCKNEDYNNIFMIGEDKDIGGLVFYVIYDEDNKPWKYYLNHVYYMDGKIVEKTRAVGRISETDYQIIEKFSQENNECNEILYTILKTGVTTGANLCEQLSQDKVEE